MFRFARLSPVLLVLLLLIAASQPVEADYDCCLPTGLVAITNLEITLFCWDCCCPGAQGEDCTRQYTETVHRYGGYEYLYEGACGEGEACNETVGAIPCGQGGWSKQTEWEFTLGVEVCDYCEVDSGCYPRPPNGWEPDEWRICLCPPEEDCATYLLWNAQDPCEVLGG